MGKAARQLGDDEFVIIRDDKGAFILAPHTRLVAVFDEAEKHGEDRVYLSLTPAWLAYCCVCSRVVDTREASAGGDPFGCELNDGRWTCSTACYDEVVA